MVPCTILIEMGLEDLPRWYRVPGAARAGDLLPVLKASSTMPSERAVMTPPVESTLPGVLVLSLMHLFIGSLRLIDVIPAAGGHPSLAVPRSHTCSCT